MATNIKSKHCSACKTIKTISDFNRNKARKDGYDNCCRKCHSERNKQYYQENRSEYSERHKKYYKKNKIKYLERQRKYNFEYQTKHPDYHKKYNNTIYGHLRCIYCQMLHRCNNPKYVPYKNYGGRGIKVKFACFEDFFNYVTKKLKTDPRGLTIDRIDNDGNYEPGNIRFVTRAENNRNKRKRYKFEFMERNKK